MKTLAIIKSVRYGLDGYGRVGLSFGTYVAEGLGAPQYLEPAQASDLLAGYGVSDVSQLEGKPCWVIVSGSRCLYLEPALI